MEQGSRAILALAVLTGSCAASAAERGGASAGAADATAAEAGSVPDFRRVPRWIRPAARDLERSANVRAGALSAERGDADRAAMLLRQARAEGPCGPETAALHAWVLGEAGLAAAGERLARAALEEHGAGSASLNYALAVTCELDGRPAEALDAYRIVLLADPEDPVLLRACARAALAAGEPAAALACLETLARRGEADPTLLAQRAAAAHGVAQSSGDPARRAQARALLLEVTRLDPQHAAAHRMLGESLAADGDLAGAEAALRRALEIEPADAGAGLLLAGALRVDGRAAAARAVLEDLLRQPLDAAELRAVRAELLQLPPR